MNLADDKSEKSEQSSIDVEERERALKFKLQQRKIQRQKNLETKPSDTGSPNNGSSSPLASQTGIAEDKEIHELEEVEQ